ncbi:hypothetical protein [Caballeronia sp. LZ032]|uniref:hypothetical protein n=1 Tax=Caballeronia sp. LZ032 TaxID=3038565 RepID=UPI002864298E|nr:hypothetical protein [Caballeronia sp. LZ032]MDR5879655.1 hypothetical protein [Caballeronia sp. LZ032]
MIRRSALVLAAASTGTAVCISVLAGWQRGGWLSERLVWVAMGVVLVASAHLLPALCRPAPVAVRAVGFVLWLGCMGAASFGHATFFLLSQLHAGEVRIAAIPVISVPAHRTLTAVMADRVSVVSDLAVVNARHCIRDCSALWIRRASLAARLNALDAEATDVRRYQVIENGNVARRDSARDDPVTARLAALRGVADMRLDLFVGLAFAAVLECTACLLWWIAMQPRQEAPRVTDHDGLVSPIMVAVATGREADAPSVTTMTELEIEVSKLRRDIDAGIVRPTVASIRQYLNCSQARAAALRKRVVDATT